MNCKLVDDGSKYKVSLSLDQDNDVRVMAYNYVSLNSMVLDVGCACGDFGALLVDGKRCDVYGMDYNAKSIEVASSLNVYKRLDVVDLNTFISDDFEMYQNKFDCITLLDVLEHLVRPEDSLLRLAPYLKGNGKLIISLPNISFGDIKLQLLQDDFIYADTGILDRTHLRFFTWRSIAIFFSELGFEINNCQAKVSDVSVPPEMPFYINYFVKKNINSYIYQYVLELNPSQLNFEESVQANMKKMVLKYSDIEPRLRTIRKFKWRNKLFPVGSLQRGLAKVFYRKIFNKENNTMTDKQF